MDRKCNICVCHTSGSCSAWECRGTVTVEDVKEYGARKFAEWLPQHFDLRFSNNPSVWLDEFFNHTRDKVLAEVQKGAG